MQRPVRFTQCLRSDSSTPDEVMQLVDKAIPLRVTRGTSLPKSVHTGVARECDELTSSLEARHNTVTVCPKFFTPVTFTSLWPVGSAPEAADQKDPDEPGAKNDAPDTLISSTRPAVPSLSAVSESGCVTGVHPRVLEMKSISSRSMSCTELQHLGSCLLLVASDHRNAPLLP